LILPAVNQAIRCQSSNGSWHQQSGSCPANAQTGKWVEGAIGMVWNHFAVKLATRKGNFLCDRLAVPPRIVPHGVLGNNPHGRGLKEVHADIRLVSFMDYDPGYFDLETRELEPLENPFGPRV
jgi:hypothetical protein